MSRRTKVEKRIQKQKEKLLNLQEKRAVLIKNEEEENQKLPQGKLKETKKDRKKKKKREENRKYLPDGKERKEADMAKVSEVQFSYARQNPMFYAQRKSLKEFLAPDALDPNNYKYIGAGTDFLYNLLIQLLGRELTYAVEEPGYGKIRKIYAAAGARVLSVPMDERGVIPGALEQAQVLHISPSHHFPTGLVTPLSRRMELLNWARQGGNWIIEDDYDSEFRFDAHPMAAMQSLDLSGRVIYMNSFSKTLAPSIRISYMVLPRELLLRFRQQLGFYSCTVPSFEQYTLARFLTRGHFEKHINRMRKFYKARRNRVISALKESQWAPRLTILEQDAGLHFLLKVETALSDRELVAMLSSMGIRVHALSEYFHSPMGDPHCLVVNYATIREDALTDILKLSE